MHRFFLLSALFLSTCFAMKQTNMVAFRMDDLQDKWLNDIQIAVMKTFKDDDLPYTIGAIGNKFGKDPKITNWVNNALATDWDVEVCNHGFDHEDFRTFTLAQQTNLLIQGAAQTKAALSNLEDEIMTFIPPFNWFNDDTITALHAAGYDVLSSQASMYYPVRTRTYPGNNPDLVELPVSASTTDLPDVYRVSSNVTFAEIKDQMTTKGFSVVMMHFKEFINADETLNQTSLDDLKTLIQMCKDANYQFVTLRSLRTALISNETNGGSPAATTASVSTTGAQAAVTTVAMTTGSVTTAAASTTGAAVTTASVSTTGVADVSTTGEVVAATTASEDSCQAASLDCVCSADNTCDAGLTCSNGLCVASTNNDEESEGGAAAVSAFLGLSLLLVLL